MIHSRIKTTGACEISYKRGGRQWALISNYQVFKYANVRRQETQEGVKKKDLLRIERKSET